MKIQANERKQLNTAVLNHLFTQGEAGVDVVCIQLPLQYGQADLTSLGWTVQLVGEKDSFVSKVLEKEMTEEALILRWLVDEDCTAASGKVKVTVVGTSEDGKTVIKFDGNSIFVKEAAYGSFAPAPDTLAAALLQVQRASEEAVSAARSATIDALAAQEAASRSPYIGADGFWYVFDKEKGEYGKSEIPAQGPAGPQGPAGESGGVQSVNGVLPDENGDVAIDLPSGTGIRPNLLDNWYFGNPVNQRGQTSYTANGYTIDRWKSNSSALTTTVANGYITLSSTAQPLLLQQTFETPIKSGTRVTLSAVVRGKGVIRAANASTTFGVLAFDTEEWKIVYSSFISDEQVQRVEFRMGSKEVCDILAVKLELGDGQTLAHQDADGNWVLNEIPDYAEELAKCQRYQQLIAGAASIFLNAQRITANTIYFSLPLTVPLRDTPSLVYVSSGSISIMDSINGQNGVAGSGFTFSATYGAGASVIRLNANKTGHGWTNASINMSNCLLDANL